MQWLRGKRSKPGAAGDLAPSSEFSRACVLAPCDFMFAEFFRVSLPSSVTVNAQSGAPTWPGLSSPTNSHEKVVTRDTDLFQKRSLSLSSHSSLQPGPPMKRSPLSEVEAKAELDLDLALVALRATVW